MLKRLYSLITVLLALSTFSQAQDATLKGRVRDEKTREPLPFATVMSADRKHGVQTDQEGRFKLVLPAGKFVLLFNYISYKSESRLLDLAPGELVELDILLAPDMLDFRQIVITGNRSRQRIEETVTSMDVLPQQLLERRADNTIETAVEQVPGVTVIDGQANIRGGSGFSYGAGSRVLVLVDDLPMLAGDANDVKWNFIPVEQMEQAEVLKGASSALFGSSALNGVINLRTAMPGDTALTLINAFVGAYDQPSDVRMRWWDEARMTSGFSLSHRQRFGKVALVSGGQYVNDRGYREGETEERVRANAHVRFPIEKLSGLTAGLAVNAQRAKGGSFLIWQNDTTGALLPFGGTLSTYTSDRFTFDPYLTYTSGPWIHKLKTRYFLSNNTNNTAQGSRSEVFYADYLSQRKFLERIDFTIGASASTTRVAGELFDKQRGSNMAGYLQGDGSFGKLKLSLGARVEGGSISGKQFDPQLLFRTGMNYEAWKGGFVRASYGQGFRFPSIAEQYVRTRVGDIVIYPNDSLFPERGWSGEVGVRQLLSISSWKGMADFSLFQMEYQDMMEFSFGLWGNPFVDPFGGLGFRSVNIGNARITGLEMTLTGQGKIGQVEQSILGGYTWIDPVQTDFDLATDTIYNTSKENVLKYRFRNMFKFDSESRYRKWIGGFSLRYYSRIENIDKIFELAIAGVKSYRERQPEGSWLADVRAGYVLNDGATIMLNVRNVFNTEFMTRPADLQAPRSVLLSVIVRL